MRFRGVARFLIWSSIVFLLASGGYVFWWVKSHGFSAREQPSRVEQWLARQARWIAMPSGASSLKNPLSASQENLISAREHFAQHCAVCHGLDGRGDTVIGRNVYPKSPDMRQNATQSLSDGELYYIISNGIRFTGMPAWGDEDSPEEIWKLVPFIRRLPYLTREELEAMEKIAAGKEDPQASGARQEHSHPLRAKPHRH